MLKIKIELKDINRLEEVSVFACKNLIAYGIFEKVEIVIYEWLPEKNQKMIERKSFSCTNGKIEDA